MRTPRLKPCVAWTIAFCAALLSLGLGVPTSQAAFSDRYSVRFKAWIPQTEAIGTTVGMNPSNFCMPWPTATVRFNGNGHRNYVNGANGDFKTMVTYDFLWNGSTMSDLDAVARYGITHATMTNSLTGSECEMDRRASGHSRVESTGPAGAKLILDSADPFYPDWLIPNLNGEISLSFDGADHLIVDAITDSFPSYAYEVYRNDILVATVQILDGHCVDLTGPGGVLNTAVKLTVHYDNPVPRQHIDTRAQGLNYFQPCDDPRVVPPLPFPAVTQTPIRPDNVLPTAAFTYTRLAGKGGIVSLDARRSTDADGDIRAWRWFAGDSLIATGPWPTLSLGSTKSVTLTVTDNEGGSGSTTRTVSIVNRAPRLVQTMPVADSVAGTNTPTLSAVALDDDGDSLSFSYRVTGYQVDISSESVAGAWAVPEHRLDPGSTYTWTVTVRDPSGASATASSQFSVASLPTAADVITTASGDGYWQVASDGGVFSYGDAQFYGSVPGLGIHLNTIMGMARTPSGHGYWLVGTDGGVFAFGDAGFFGSLPGLGIEVNNVVGMAASKSGNGYWLVASDGGVFAFGDAPFYGSMGGQPLQAPVDAMAVTPSGDGYWLAARDGGVFAFGNAPFYGSMGGQPLAMPVTDIDPTPDGGGYWLSAEDGGVFAFGNAQFYGSMAGRPLNGHITGMSATISGRGYWLNGCDGGIFAFGDAVFFGSNPTYQCRGVWSKADEAGPPLQDLDRASATKDMLVAVSD